MRTIRSNGCRCWPGGADTMVPSLIGVQPDEIALRLRDQGQRGGERARGVELAQTRVWAGRVGVLHGGRGVEEQAHRDRRFDLALAHEITVGTREEFPVDVTWLIAGLVGAVLRELPRQPRLTARVQTGQHPGGEALRGERQAARGGEQFRVEDGGTSVARFRL